MIFKGIFLLLVCLVTGLTILIAVIVALVKRRDENVRNHSLVIAGLSLVIFLVCGIYLSVKTFYVVKYESERVAYRFATSFDEDMIESNPLIGFLSEHLSGRYFDSAYMDSIKSMQPDDRIIPGSYYYCSGFRDYYRMPVVYPYSLVAIDNLEDGVLYDESAVKNAFVSTKDKKDVLTNIVCFTFDAHYLLAELQSQGDDRSVQYVLLDFKTGELKQFDTKEQMTNFAKESGFDINNRAMITPKEYYRSF